jgi:hypothetical protein
MSTVDNRPIVQGAIAAWIGVLAGSFTGSPFALPSVTVYLWALIALAVSSTRPPEPGPITAAPADPA